jgi:hypothetical protein
MSMKGIGGSTGSCLYLPHRPGRLMMGTGGFRPNAVAAPDTTLFRGTLKGLFTVTYGATGLYTVTFTPAGFKFPTGELPNIQLQATRADLTNTHRFQVEKQGDWNNTTRSFVISARQESAAFAVPSNADNWIDFVIIGKTSARP